MIQPKHNVSIERATDLLESGQPLIDLYIDGNLIIETGEISKREVVFENCIINCFLANMIQFSKHVRLTACHFKNCQFAFTYFLDGLTINNCIFDNYLDFQAGGHNKIGSRISIINNNFKNFVNFYDCWYENEVMICNNDFFKGTNLLGELHNISVTFAKQPTIENNTGKLDLDNEGESHS